MSGFINAVVQPLPFNVQMHGNPGLFTALEQVIVNFAIHFHVASKLGVLGLVGLDAFHTPGLLFQQAGQRLDSGFHRGHVCSRGREVCPQFLVERVNRFFSLK